MTVRNQAIAWLSILVVLVLLLVFLREVLFPFVAGFAIAYFLDPVCDRLERWGLSRTWATVLVTALFFVVFVLIVALLVPVLYAQVVQFLTNLPGYIDALQTKTAPLLALVREQFSDGAQPFDVNSFLKQHLGAVADISIGILGKFVGGLQVTFNIISLFVITPVVAFYLLRDWDQIIARVDSCLPRAHVETIREQARLVDETLAGFLRGQFTVCLLLGLFYGIGLSLVGLEFGLIIGLGTGLVSFIPYFGMLIGFVVGVGLAFAQFDTLLPIAMVIVVFVVGQFLEGNFLTPKLVGDRVNLHAVWIMFALLAGAALFGFVGVLLAVPVAAVIGVLVRFSLSRYRESPLYLGTSGSEPPSERRP
ncbi:MAG: AI-2E family transporter [Pseudomonadota bacterium]